MRYPRNPVQFRNTITTLQTIPLRVPLRHTHVFTGIISSKWIQDEGPARLRDRLINMPPDPLRKHKTPFTLQKSIHTDKRFRNIFRHVTSQATNFAFVCPDIHDIRVTGSCSKPPRTEDPPWDISRDQNMQMSLSSERKLLYPDKFKPVSTFCEICPEPRPSRRNTGGIPSLHSQCKKPPAEPPDVVTMLKPP
ncbi:hypothetical protein ES708_20235 [subsurface metagenome]